MIVSKRRITILLILCLTGCQSPSEPEPEKTVFVDAKTQEVFVLDSGVSSPAVHPKTGKKTLRQGVYCSACKKWYAVPELEVVQKNPEAAFCPTHKTRMSAEGPLPEIENSTEETK